MYIEGGLSLFENFTATGRLNISPNYIDMEEYLTGGEDIQIIVE